MTTRRPDDDDNAGADDFESALLARQRLVPRFDAHADDAPSPELDRRVLARARDALRQESPPQLQRHVPRWAVPVALAATVLLSFGLVMQLDPARNDTLLAPTAPVAMQESTSEAAAAKAPPRPARGESVAQSSAAPDSDAAPFVADAPAAAPAPAPPAALPPAATRARETAMARVSDEPAAAAAGARQATPAAAAAASSAGAGAGAGADTIPRDEPQRWLAAIERLQRDGDLEAARTELAAFRRRHPDQALPESLQRLR